MFGIFLILGSLIFVGEMVTAIRTGTTCVPIKVFEVEEFDRNEDTANFWGVTGFNAVMAAALFAYGVALL